jgi:hypothetical protein
VVRNPAVGRINSWNRPDAFLITVVMAQAASSTARSAEPTSRA